MSQRILIADESPTAQTFLADLLAREGYETSGAHNLIEVKQVCEGKCTDLILIDLDLPGFENLDELSNLKSIRPDLYIIALTESSRFQSGIEAMRHGADDVLVQPTPAAHLIASVERGFVQIRQTRSLSESKKRIEDLQLLNQSIIEYSPVAIAVLDLDGTIGYINSKMLELLGTRRGEFTWLGTDLATILNTLFHTTDNRFSVALDQALKDQTGCSIASWHVQVHGEDRYLDVTLSPLWAHNEGTTAGGILAVFSDITRWIISNQLLNSVLKDSSDAIIVTDHELIIRMWSRGASLLFGYESDEIIGHPLKILLPPSPDGTPPTGVTDVIPGTAVRTRRRNKHGSLLDVRLSHSVLTDPQGRSIGVCEIISDITADIKRERDIQEIKDFYERIIDTISDCIRVIEVPSGQIVLANKAHRERLGLHEEEILGQRHADIGWGLHADTASKNVNELVADAVRSGATERMTYAFTAGSGMDVCADVAAFPMLSDDILEHIVLVGRDITEYMRLETERATLRDRRERFFQAAPVGIITTDSEGKIDFVNHWMVDILGQVDTEAVIGKNLMGIDVIQQMGIADKLVDVLAEGRSLKQKHLSCINAQGRALILNIRAEPYSDPNNTVVGLVAAIENMTETHQLRKRLSATTADLAMLAEVGTVFQESRESDVIIQAILVGITAGEGLGFNRAFFLAADSEKQELRGRFAIGPLSKEEAWQTWDALAGTPHTLYEVAKGYQEVRNQHTLPINDLARKLTIPIENIEEIIAHSPTEPSAFLISQDLQHPFIPQTVLDQLGSDPVAVVPLANEGAIEGVILADNAITQKSITDDDLRSLELFATQAMMAMERTRLYSELEQRLHELQEANLTLKKNQETMLQMSRMQAVGEMAAEVAHEIRNPLTAIGGFARTIKKNIEIQRSMELEDTNYSFIQTIIEESDRLEKLLGGILDLSKQHNVETSPVDLSQLLEKIFRMTEWEIAETDIKTQIHVPSEEVIINANKDKITQVVRNLIHNALDAMQKASDDTPLNHRLTVKLDIQGKYAITRVEDTGGGLSEDAMQKLFEPFFTTKQHGTGLGLSICQQIITDHGGEIDVKNNDSGGATFSVILPRVHEEAENGANSCRR